MGHGRETASVGTLVSRANAAFGKQAVNVFTKIQPEFVYV